RMSDFHLPALDNEPHVLVHGDMNPSNIIINNQKFSAVYPRFLTNEPRLVGEEFDWAPCAYSQTQKDDRSSYLQCIKDLAPTKGEYAGVYADILSRDNEEEWYWWLSAVNRRDIMRAL
ncbi:hypothetical protein BU24DRAFT_321689, partial [Aaosphaeria arxii CBS 175.79]